MAVTIEGLLAKLVACRLDFHRPFPPSLRPNSSFVVNCASVGPCIRTKLSEKGPCTPTSDAVWSSSAQRVATTCSVPARARLCIKSLRLLQKVAQRRPTRPRKLAALVQLRKKPVMSRSCGQTLKSTNVSRIAPACAFGLAQRGPKEAPDSQPSARPLSTPVHALAALDVWLVPCHGKLSLRRTSMHILSFTSPELQVSQKSQPQKPANYRGDAGVSATVSCRMQSMHISMHRMPARHASSRRGLKGLLVLRSVLGISWRVVPGKRRGTTARMDRRKAPGLSCQPPRFAPASYHAPLAYFADNAFRKSPRALLHCRATRAQVPFVRLHAARSVSPLGVALDLVLTSLILHLSVPNLHLGQVGIARKGCMQMRSLIQSPAGFKAMESRRLGLGRARQDGATMRCSPQCRVSVLQLLRNAIVPSVGLSLETCRRSAIRIMMLVLTEDLLDTSPQSPDRSMVPITPHLDPKRLRRVLTTCQGTSWAARRESQVQAGTALVSVTPTHRQGPVPVLPSCTRLSVFSLLVSVVDCGLTAGSCTLSAFSRRGTVCNLKTLQATATLLWHPSHFKLSQNPLKRGEVLRTVKACIASGLKPHNGGQKQLSFFMSAFAEVDSVKPFRRVTSILTSCRSCSVSSRLQVKVRAGNHCSSTTVGQICVESHSWRLPSLARLPALVFHSMQACPGVCSGLDGSCVHPLVPSNLGGFLVHVGFVCKGHSILPSGLCLLRECSSSKPGGQEGLKAPTLQQISAPQKALRCGSDPGFEASCLSPLSFILRREVGCMLAALCSLPSGCRLWFVPHVLLGLPESLVNMRCIDGVGSASRTRIRKLQGLLVAAQSSSCHPLELAREQVRAAGAAGAVGAAGSSRPIASRSSKVQAKALIRSLQAVLKLLRSWSSRRGLRFARKVCPSWFQHAALGRCNAQVHVKCVAKFEAHPVCLERFQAPRCYPCLLTSERASPQPQPGCYPCLLTREREQAESCDVLDKHKHVAPLPATLVSDSLEQPGLAPPLEQEALSVPKLERLSPARGPGGAFVFLGLQDMLAASAALCRPWLPLRGPLAHRPPRYGKTPGELEHRMLPKEFIRPPSLEVAEMPRCLQVTRPFWLPLAWHSDSLQAPFGPGLAWTLKESCLQSLNMGVCSKCHTSIPDFTMALHFVLVHALSYNKAFEDPPTRFLLNHRKEHKAFPKPAFPMPEKAPAKNACRIWSERASAGQVNILPPLLAAVDSALSDNSGGFGKLQPPRSACRVCSAVFWERERFNVLARVMPVATVPGPRVPQLPELAVLAPVSALHIRSKAKASAGPVPICRGVLQDSCSIQRLRPFQLWKAIWCSLRKRRR
ncbi:unnamed protein product [Symbiodinium sp. CCMP2592]|nr:unnamed protein product [Symbiodinium sp. CCMP2592]